MGVYVGCIGCGKETPEVEALWARLFGLADNEDGSPTYVCQSCATARFDHADRKIVSKIKPRDADEQATLMLLTEPTAKA